MDRSKEVIAIIAIDRPPPPEENPRVKVHPEAIESLKRYKDDLKAGHTAAAEFWRGQAGAYFTANPRRKPKRNPAMPTWGVVLIGALVLALLPIWKHESTVTGVSLYEYLGYMITHPREHIQYGEAQQRALYAYQAQNPEVME